MEMRRIEVFLRRSAIVLSAISAFYAMETWLPAGVTPFMGAAAVLAGALFIALARNAREDLAGCRETRPPYRLHTRDR